MRWPVGRAGPNLALAAVELPGGPWVQRGERRDRLGRDASSSAAARRAGDAGLRGSWRSYQWPDLRVECWLQVTPLLGPADADEALAGLTPARMVANPAFAGRAEGPPESVVAPEVAGARGAAAVEQAMSLPDGPYRSLLLFFAVGRYVVAGSLAGPADAVTWAWWGEAASRQAAALAD